MHVATQLRLLNNPPCNSVSPPTKHHQLGLATFPAPTVRQPQSLRTYYCRRQRILEFLSIC